MNFRKNPVAKIALVFGLIIPLVVVVEIFGRMSGVAGDLYSIFGAPFVEEAFKALMLMVVVLLTIVLVWRKPLERLGSKLAWFAGGFGIGLIFGLYENLTSYSFSAERAIPTLNHAVWTGLVGVGIYFYVRSKVSLTLLLPFLAAAGAHAIWNFGAFLRGTGADLGFLACGAASWALAVGAIVVVGRCATSRRC